MNDVEKRQLPKNWIWSTMSEISDVISGGTPRSTEKKYYDGGKISWITPADLSGYKEKYISHGGRYITEAGLQNSSARLVPSGTVLFTSRAPIGYVAIAKNEVCTNQGFKSFILNKELVTPDYVYWWLKGSKQLAESFASGTTFLELSGSKAKQLPIPVAPLNQQKQIVAKIEELFSHIDAGIAALNKTKQLLKQYRQSVLKAAVTGELTKQWREENKDKIEPASKLLERILIERRKKWEEQQLEQFKAKGKIPKDDKWKDKYQEPINTVLDGLPDLPEEWLFVCLDSLIVDGPQNGLYLPKTKYGSGVPIVRIDDFQDGYIRSYQELQKVEASVFEIKTYGMNCGDLVVNRVNSPTHLGKCMVVKDDFTPCLYESNMMKAEISSHMNVDYIDFYIQSKFGRSRLIKNAKWAVNQASINQQDVRGCEISLPPINEQEEIVKTIEGKISAMKRLDEELVKKIKMAEKNKQSILASAFSGNIL